MVAQSMKKLADLFVIDLAGWEIGYCHFLELEHSCMGTFPAIRLSDGAPMLVAEKGLLKLVWEAVGQCQARTSSFLGLFNRRLGLVFNLEAPGSNKGNSVSLKLFGRDEIQILVNTPNGLGWAPGLLGGSEGIASPLRFD